MIQSKKTTNKTLLKYSILLFWVAAHLYLSIQVSHLESQSKNVHSEQRLTETKKTKEGDLKKEEPIMSRSKRSTSVVIGAHAVGYQKVLGKQKSPYSHTVMKGDYFGWNLTSPLTYKFNVKYTHNDQGSTFLQVETSGFYYIYSQIGFLTLGRNEVCYQTVARPGLSGEVVLMESCTSQVRVPRNRSTARWLDTAYQGGVFYLYSSDEIAVRPKQDIQDNNHLFYMDSTKSFFGLYFLSK